MTSKNTIRHNAVDAGCVDSWLVSAGRDHRPGAPLNVPPVRRYPLTTCASQIVPLGIRECVEGLSDPGSSGSIEQNPRLRGCRNVWYVERNYDAGVLPASFFEV